MRDDIKWENGREQRPSESKSERRGGSEGGLNAGSGFSGGGGLPSPDSLRKPKTEEEAEKMLKLGERMISLSLEVGGSLSDPEREALKAVFTTIVAKMKVKHHDEVFFLYSFESHSQQAKRGMSSTRNGHSDRSGGKRALATNSRSPSPPLKRERRSSRSPPVREGSSRSSWGERGSRDYRGSREERNGREPGFAPRGSFEGRRGRDGH